MNLKTFFLYCLAVKFFVSDIIVSGNIRVNSDYFHIWSLDNVRISNVNRTFYNHSLLQCAIQCLAYDGCISFNWHISRLCELNTKIFDFTTFFDVGQTSWNVYEKGNCGLGIENGNHCLMLPRFLNQTQGFSFEGSRHICLSSKADLVKVDDETEMDNLNQNLNNIFPTLGDWAGKIWIGLNKINTSDFVWSDMTQPAYTNYAAGEPNLGKDCIVVTNYQKNWVWTTENCSNHWTFACERRNIK